ncbi:hypothetical protein BDV19DRAFT_199367 [Aspergillus venezuelensis]
MIYLPSNQDRICQSVGDVEPMCRKFPCVPVDIPLVSVTACQSYAEYSRDSNSAVRGCRSIIDCYSPLQFRPGYSSIVAPSIRRHFHLVDRALFLLSLGVHQIRKEYGPVSVTLIVRGFSFIQTKATDMAEGLRSSNSHGAWSLSFIFRANSYPFVRATPNDAAAGSLTRGNLRFPK